MEENQIGSVYTQKRISYTAEEKAQNSKFGSLYRLPSALSPLLPNVL